MPKLTSLRLFWYHRHNLLTDASNKWRSSTVQSCGGLTRSVILGEGGWQGRSHFWVLAAPGGSLQNKLECHFHFPLFWVKVKNPLQISLSWQQQVLNVGLSEKQNVITQIFEKQVNSVRPIPLLCRCFVNCRMLYKRCYVCYYLHT